MASYSDADASSMYDYSDYDVAPSSRGDDLISWETPNLDHMLQVSPYHAEPIDIGRGAERSICVMASQGRPEYFVDECALPDRESSSPPMAPYQHSMEETNSRAQQPDVLAGVGFIAGNSPKACSTFDQDNAPPNPDSNPCFGVGILEPTAFAYESTAQRPEWVVSDFEEMAFQPGMAMFSDHTTELSQQAEQQFQHAPDPSLRVGPACAIGQGPNDPRGLRGLQRLHSDTSSAAATAMHLDPHAVSLPLRVDPWHPMNTRTCQQQDAPHESQMPFDGGVGGFPEAPGHTYSGKSEELSHPMPGTPEDFGANGLVDSTATLKAPDHSFLNGLGEAVRGPTPGDDSFDRYGVITNPTQSPMLFRYVTDAPPAPDPSQPQVLSSVDYHRISDNEYPNRLIPPNRMLGHDPSSPTPSAASSSTETTLVCRECGTQFKGEYRKGNLARHVRLKHGNEVRRYPCEQPDCRTKPFKRQDARLKHYRKHHPWLAPEPPLRRKT